MKTLSVDKYRAMRFKYAYRSIDDECNLNYGGEFGRLYRSIYPPEPELKCVLFSNLILMFLMVFLFFWHISLKA